MSEELTQFAAINQRAINKVIYDELSTLYKSEIKADPIAFVQKHYPSAIEPYKVVLEKIDEKAKNQYQSNTQLSPQQTKALFVTFAPEDGIIPDTQSWVKLITKLLKRTAGIIKTYGALEQRGENEEELGMGIHFHVLLILNKETQDGELTRNAKRVINMLEKYKTKTPCFLDIKRVSSEKLEDKIKYIKGQKDPEKAYKCKMDMIWREENSIPNYWDL